MSQKEQIETFLAAPVFAVVGASNDRDKYGNKVLRAFQMAGRRAFPVHPKEAVIEGLQAYPDLASLPEPVGSVSVITPPAVTEKIVEQAGRLGIKNLWLQPGAESERAIEIARSHGMNIIAGGPCILIALRYRES